MSKKLREAMRQRREEKARQETDEESLALADDESMIKEARKLPFMECYITEGWENGGGVGLLHVVVSRQRPDERIVFASFLLDVFCLGVKDAMYETGLSKSKFKSLVRKFFTHTKAEKCSPELAHQMVYECIDYAAQFGFEPHKDFEIAQNVLDPRGSLETPYKLTFGKDGKPFFIAGPYDNTRAILAKLNKKPGKGNFNYMADPGSLFGEL